MDDVGGQRWVSGMEGTIGMDELIEACWMGKKKRKITISTLSRRKSAILRPYSKSSRKTTPIGIRGLFLEIPGPDFKQSLYFGPFAPGGEGENKWDGWMDRRG